MKSTKLIQMLFILLEKKKVTAKELSTMLSVSQRTIYRYVDSLSLANIPIYSDQGKNGGIYIRNDFLLNHPLLDNLNLENILTSLRTISKTGTNIDYENTLKKIKSLISTNEKTLLHFKENKLFIDTSSDELYLSAKVIEQLNFALNNLYTIKFKYINAEDDEYICTVEPYRLIFKQSHWFLQGYFIETNSFKVFDIIRITDLEITKKIFTIRYLDYSNIPLLAWINDNTFTVELLVHEDARSTIAKYYGEKVFQEFNPPYYKAKIKFSNIPTEYGFLFVLGDKIKILSPQHIKDKFLNQLDSIKNIY